MTETDKRARTAGAVYLLVALPAFFSMVYVPDRLIVHADLLATMDRTIANEALLRWGIGVELLAYAAWALVPLTLYRLLADVDRGLARAMLVLGLMTTPIVFIGDAAALTSLSLLHEARLAAALPADELKALAGFGVRFHGESFVAAEVFWGAWLFPFAALVWRSGFLPRFLAVLLAVGGLGWLVDSMTTVLAPASVAAVGPFTRTATSMGELPIIFWLLLVGARPASRPGRSGAASAAAGA